MITESKEDYVKAILEAESEGRTVISTTLADWLSVSRPAITLAVRRLKKDGLVSVHGRRLKLTPSGRRIALRVTMRHHLIERMLGEIFGMEWYRVHDEAERLEHAVSPAFEAHLLERLGNEGTCPHGNLSELEDPASRRSRGLLLLAQAEPGKNYVVSGIYERDRRLLEFLEARGIRPGARVRVKQYEKNRALVLVTDAGSVTLGRSAAQRIWVSKRSSSSVPGAKRSNK